MVAQGFGIGSYELLVILFALVAGVLGTALTVISFWKICSKAGFPGPLSLLMIVPIANIILPLYIAFSDWPSLKQNP